MGAFPTLEALVVQKVRMMAWVLLGMSTKELYKLRIIKCIILSDIRYHLIL